jgi:hypothetical protein
MVFDALIVTERVLVDAIMADEVAARASASMSRHRRRDAW